MARYIVETPHSPEECLRTMDALEAKGADYLAKFDFGCLHGEHTAFGRIDAASEKAACDEIPSSLRPKARVTQVDRFTPDQVRKFHQAH
jgi:hypothetical protein